METRSAEYFFLTLQGSSYEIGRMQAEAISRVPGWLEFLRSAPRLFEPQAFKMIQAQYNRFCPGIVEEIEGFADYLKLPSDQIMYYAATSLRAGHCSHIAVLPQFSADGHMRVGRSYEFNDQQEDYRLCRTRPDGKYAHLGTSTLLFGRGEGLNEAGLCVTTSSGGIPVGNNMSGLHAPIQDGFQFWALVRSLLENCRTVDEGLAWIREFPLGCNPILILADRSGQAARVEAYGPHLAVKKLGPDSAEGCLFAANHFVMPEMEPHRQTIMPNSAVRVQRMSTLVAEKAPRISSDDLHSLLGTLYPQGLCCHYYDEGFGTLRSMIFDLTAAQVEVCFGSPQANPWHRFDLKSGPDFAAFPVKLPKEKTAPGFWSAE